MQSAHSSTGKSVFYIEIAYVTLPSEVTTKVTSAS